MAKCNPLRTYLSRKRPTPSCTILEAARAVISSPGALNPVKIGDSTNAWVSIEATSRYPNPIQELLRQAQDHFGHDQQVATILSLGAGKPVLTSLEEECGTSGSLDEVLRRMVEDCEIKHEETYRRLKNIGVYFRLNVDRGFEWDSLRNKESATTVQEHTDTYLEGEAVSDIIDELVTSLILRKCSITLKRLSE